MFCKFFFIKGKRELPPVFEVNMKGTAREMTPEELEEWNHMWIDLIENIEEVLRG